MTVLLCVSQTRSEERVGPWNLRMASAAARELDFRLEAPLFLRYIREAKCGGVA